MTNLLRRLLPQSEEHLLMGRSGAAPALDAAASDVEMPAIRSADDPSVESLETFASANGFPAGWAAGMIGEGASAVIARDTASGATLAMAWMTQQPFHVEEIGATIDPRTGVYLFGDFVAPAHRGRKLQQRLVAQRLRLAASAAFAVTLVHPSNLASLRSYQQEGFTVGARFLRYRWRSRTWTRCKPVARAAVTFALDQQHRIIAS
jgi:ribosomal protein S18 acetylase RimI-like enzyme